MNAPQPKDGGAAFPRPASYDKFNDENFPPWDGMSLRDWFAGMAMQGELASEQYGNKDCKMLAEWCYLVADAMLQARGKQ